MDPPLSWANIADCGSFPCTGPRNLVAKFKTTTFKGLVGKIGLNEDF